MSALLAVLEPGPRTLLVDAGRPGLEHLGLPRGGAADPELHAAALLVAGAPTDAATLECTAAGPTLECRDEPVRIAVAGDCGLRLSPAGGGPGRSLSAWTAHTLAPGDRLRLGATSGPLRAYLAAAPGIAVAPQLGSRSASLRGGLEGLLARPLRAGDVLPIAPGRPWGAGLRLRPPVGLLSGGPLRVCPGPHASVLDGDLERLLASRSWTVSPRSDRTGVRLEGAPLPLHTAPDVASLGCAPGAIQVGGDGLPILLGCDRGTTGGYAVVAVLAGVDLARLGRLRPGEEVRLELVEVAEAVRLRRARAVLMATLPGLLQAAPRVPAVTGEASPER